MMRIPVRLVAVLTDVDPENLLVNILSSLNHHSCQKVIVSASVNSEENLVNELSGIEKDELQSILKRLNHSIVTVDFIIEDILILLSIIKLFTGRKADEKIDELAAILKVAL